MAGDWIRSKALDDVHAWLEEGVGSLEPMSPDMVKSMKAEYKRVVSNEVTKGVRERAERAAQTILDGMLLSEVNECVEREMRGSAKGE